MCVCRAAHPCAMLQSTLIICSLTWTVLVPMLLASPDTAKVTYWRARLFCFESYNVSAAVASALMSSGCCASGWAVAEPVPCPTSSLRRCPQSTPPPLMLALQQHGFNIAMMLGELALSRVPGTSAMNL